MKDVVTVCSVSVVTCQSHDHWSIMGCGKPKHVVGEMRAEINLVVVIV